MIWLRVGVLATVATLLVLVLRQPPGEPSFGPVAARADAPAQPATPSPPAPAPPPTRVPLPTAPPQMIISRVGRETPLPRPTGTPLAQPQVSIVDNGFLTPQLTLHVGDAVTWVNTGSDGHDVTGNGPGGVWRSGPLAPSERYERQFALPGTYDYACSIHPEMRGRILVQP